MQGREGGGLSQGPAEWVLSRKNSTLYILFPQCLGHTQWYSWATLGLVLRGPYIAGIQPQTICMKSCIQNYKLSPGLKMVSMCVVVASTQEDLNDLPAIIKGNAQNRTFPLSCLVIAGLRVYFLILFVLGFPNDA